MNLMTINFVYCKQLDTRDEINRKARDRPGKKKNENSNIITSINDTLCQIV